MEKEACSLIKAIRIGNGIGDYSPITAGPPTLGYRVPTSPREVMFIVKPAIQKGTTPTGSNVYLTNLDYKHRNSRKSGQALRIPYFWVHGRTLGRVVVCCSIQPTADRPHKANAVHLAVSVFASCTPSGCYFCSDVVIAKACFGGFFVRQKQKM